MNRRQFFKGVAAVCAGAVAIPVTLAGSTKKFGADRWPSYYKRHRGISHEDLCDLISTTLKDLPPGMMEVMWTKGGVK